jgi:hypothetical protein
MTHTKGPWEINSGIRPPRIYATAAPETTITDMPRWHMEHWDERLANARLIAASPDLLKALENARRAMIVSVTGISGGITIHDTEQWIKHADAAIAKARGQT